MTKFSSLKELFAAMKAREIADWTDLPVFGGPDIQDTNQVWSWDETNAIVGSCSDDIKIVDRSSL